MFSTTGTIQILHNNGTCLWVNTDIKPCGKIYIVLKYITIRTVSMKKKTNYPWQYAGSIWLCNHPRHTTTVWVVSIMVTSSNVNIFRVTGPLWGEPPVTGDSPKNLVTRNLDVFFDLHPNKQLGKQSRRRRFETSSRSLWRPCNDTIPYFT